MSDEVLLDRRPDGVALLTLNDPARRNPLSDRHMLDALVARLREVEQDGAVRVLVITGAGPAVEIAEAYLSGVQQIPQIMQRLDIPTIAAVNGPAMGAGCGTSSRSSIPGAVSRAARAAGISRLGACSSIDSSPGALRISKSPSKRPLKRVVIIACSSADISSPS